jgi:hypothetical protein
VKLLTKRADLKLDRLAYVDIDAAVSVKPPCRFELVQQKVKVSRTVSELGAKLADVAKVLEKGEKANNETNGQTELRTVNGANTRAGADVEADVEVEVDVEVILDIAHNEDAMIALSKKIKGLYPKSKIRYNITLYCLLSRIIPFLSRDFLFLCQCLLIFIFLLLLPSFAPTSLLLTLLYPFPSYSLLSYIY